MIPERYYDDYPQYKPLWDWFETNSNRKLVHKTELSHELAGINPIDMALGIVQLLTDHIVDLGVRCILNSGTVHEVIYPDIGCIDDVVIEQTIDFDFILEW